MDSARQESTCNTRNARIEEHADIRSLLSAVGLPTQDLSNERFEHFIVCMADDVVAGVVGLEHYGSSALVRSLAVAEPYRSKGIAVNLLLGIENHARKMGVTMLFTLTTTAQRYLEKQGFVVVERSQVPAAVRASAQFSDLCPKTARCLAKPIERNPLVESRSDMNESIVQRSVALFESGFYCAESVLQAIAEARNEDCRLIPRIATGFCSGVARSCGMCGAVSGAILGIGLAMGRTSADDSIDPVYKAVRVILDGFESEFGSSNCESLLGCDLGTEEGQRIFSENKLHTRCRTYVARATELALDAIETSQR